MNEYTKKQRIYFWIPHAIYLSALLTMTVLTFAFGKTPYVISLGAALLMLFVSETLRVVALWLSALEKKKASAFVHIACFDTCLLFIAGLLYVDRYFLLEDNSFFYMAALFIGAMLFVLSFFRGNGWTKTSEFSLLAKVRIGGLLAMFALAFLGFLSTSYKIHEFANGYRAYIFLPFAVIFLSYFAICFFRKKTTKVRYLWLLIEASYLVLASMALCFAF